MPIHNVTRRNLLSTGLVLAAGSPLLSKTSLAVPAGGPVPVTISATLCRNMSVAMGNSARLIHMHEANRADILTAAHNIETMREYLLETSFHTALKEAAARANPSQYNPNALASRVSSGMRPYVSGFSPRLPSNIEADLNTLRSQGLDSCMSLMVSNLRTHASYWAAQYSGGAVFEHVQSFGGSSCEAANTSIGLLGSAFFVLTLFGCTPEPMFVVLCPAINFINTLLGFGGIVSLIFC